MGPCGCDASRSVADELPVLSRYGLRDSPGLIGYVILPTLAAVVTVVCFSALTLPTSKRRYIGYSPFALVGRLGLLPRYCSLVSTFKV